MWTLISGGMRRCGFTKTAIDPRRNVFWSGHVANADHGPHSLNRKNADRRLCLRSKEIWPLDVSCLKLLGWGYVTSLFARTVAAAARNEGDASECLASVGSDPKGPWAAKGWNAALGRLT